MGAYLSTKGAFILDFNLFTTFLKGINIFNLFVSIFQIFLSDTNELFLLLFNLFLGLSLFLLGFLFLVIAITSITFGAGANIFLLVLISSNMVIFIGSLSENNVASVLTEVALGNQGAALVVVLGGLAYGGVGSDN